MAEAAKVAVTIWNSTRSRGSIMFEVNSGEIYHVFDNTIEFYLTHTGRVRPATKKFSLLPLTKKKEAIPTTS